jgi:hypothetical protein
MDTYTVTNTPFMHHFIPHSSLFPLIAWYLLMYNQDQLPNLILQAILGPKDSGVESHHSNNICIWLQKDQHTTPVACIQSHKKL